MPEFMIKKMAEDQLETLVKHFINDSPLGVVILDEALNSIFVNDEMRKIMNVKEVANEQLGNLFHCKAVVNDEAICGTKFQCENCKIRNAILNASFHDRVIKNVKVKHTFLFRGLDTVKWFDLTVIPVTVEQKPHMILLLNDQTDWMHHKIQTDLSNMFDDRITINEHDDFKRRIASRLNTTLNSSGEFLLTELEVNALWQAPKAAHEKMIEQFAAYIMRNIDSTVVFSNYSPNRLMLFFTEVNEQRVKALLEQMAYFCDMNYENRCILKRHSISCLKSDLITVPPLSPEKLNEKLERLIRAIESNDDAECRTVKL